MQTGEDLWRGKRLSDMDRSELEEAVRQLVDLRKQDHAVFHSDFDLWLVRTKARAPCWCWIVLFIAVGFSIFLAMSFWTYYPTVKTGL